MKLNRICFVSRTYSAVFCTSRIYTDLCVCFFNTLGSFYLLLRWTYCLNRSILKVIFSVSGPSDPIVLEIMWTSKASAFKISWTLLIR